MWRSWFACALLTILSSASALASRDVPIELVYRPILNMGTNEFAAMKVSLSFRGDSDGVTDIVLPNQWGGYNELYKQISAIAAKGARIEKGEEPHKIALRHKRGAVVTLSYTVTGVPRPDKLSGEDTSNEYRPIVNPTYFHLLGEAVVPQPAHVGGDAPVRFRIVGMPTGATFASDLEHAAKGRALRFNDLLESVSVGGDFRILEAGNNARLAVRGKFDERDDAGWLKAFDTVAKSVTGYWQSDAGPYLVTILAFTPERPGSISVGGTGRRDAFAFFATTNAVADTLDLIMAHEMTHSWVPRRIGNIIENETQQESYWLSEGFTDFATYRALVLSGAWGPERFAQQMNSVLAEYDALSIKALPNAEAAKLYWTSREGQRLPYLRGMLFASWLDDQLRKVSSGKSLKQILLAMQKRAAGINQEEAAKLGYAARLLRDEAATAGMDIDGVIATYIDKGQPIVFEAGFMADCGRLETRRRATFHRGFDVEATVANANTISGVKVNGPAWKAGLRDGMKLIGRRSGEVGNSEVEIVYEVSDWGVGKTLRWMPTGEGEETVRRLVLDKAKDAGCKAYLSS
jgi:predicted metalloprotease with PDZ domain